MGINHRALSVKNIKFYEKRGFKIFKTEKINSNLDLVYLEKVNDYNSFQDHL
jgi:hypothetical protein